MLRIEARVSALAFIDTEVRALNIGTAYSPVDRSVAAIEPHDFGVLAATTGFGKTVAGGG